MLTLRELAGEVHQEQQAVLHHHLVNIHTEIDRRDDVCSDSEASVSDSEASAPAPERPVKHSKQAFLQQRQQNHIDSSGSDDSNINIASADPENDVMVRPPRIKLPWILVATTVRVCRTHQYT